MYYKPGHYRCGQSHHPSQAIEIQMVSSGRERLFKFHDTVFTETGISLCDHSVALVVPDSPGAVSNVVMLCK